MLSFDHLHLVMLYPLHVARSACRKALAIGTFICLIKEKSVFRAKECAQFLCTISSRNEKNAPEWTKQNYHRRFPSTVGFMNFGYTLGCSTKDHNVSTLAWFFTSLPFLEPDRCVLRSLTKVPVGFLAYPLYPCCSLNPSRPKKGSNFQLFPKTSQTKKLMIFFKTFRR